MRNGSYANGRQRWLCKECRRSYSWSNQANKYLRERAWFYRWMIEGYSVRQLKQQSGHSQAKLYAIINYWLSSPPRRDTESLSRHRHIIFDGTFLHRPNSIVAVMDATTNEIIRGKHGVSEKSVRQLLAFFEPLRELHLEPISCTVDGNPQSADALRTVWPEIILQRCTVHIQRQGLMWCRRNPKRADAKKLRDIFLKAANIKTHRARDEFLEAVDSWEEHYGQLIASKAERGRVFSDIKRARSMLLNALPNMFHYLEDPHISPTTNGIEGYFSRLKAYYRQHRGLHKKKRFLYFEWYFFLRPR